MDNVTTQYDEKKAQYDEKKAQYDEKTAQLNELTAQLATQRQLVDDLVKLFHSLREAVERREERSGVLREELLQRVGFVFCLCVSPCSPSPINN